MEFEILDAEAIKALDAEALRKYRDDALAAARALLAGDDVSDEALANAQAIVDSKALAEAALAEIETKEAERVAKAKALRDALGEDDEDGEDDSEESDEADGDEAEEAEAKEKEAVTASATRTVKVPVRESAAARAARRQEKPVEQAPKARAVITAAADVPGYSAGQEVEGIDGIEEGVNAVVASLSRTRGATRVEKAIATINLGRTDGLVASNYPDGKSLMDAARDQKRLASERGQGSLIAAGGWCAPSETLYDLCGSESLDGLIDLPSVQVDRGGVRFTKGPQFADFYAGASFHFTEAQLIAGVEKECVTIPCPTFTDVRLDAFGVCITVDIPLESGYPEVVRRWTEGTLTAHAHRRSALLIQKALTLAGSAVTVANPWPTATGSILTALELVVMGERQRYRLPFNETMEAAFPFWIKAAIRADLAIRTGVDTLAVTDQQIEAYFASRGVRAQFLYNWQPLVGTSSGAGPVIDFPANVEILVWPAGALVQGTKDIITLNGVYDSTGLAANQYTALFTEEGISLMNPCHEVRRVTLPLQVTGLTAAAIINQDWGTAASTPAAPNVIVGA